MSAVILICGSNFCAIAGDTRLTGYKDNNSYIENNKFHKVFQLNKNVIYGVTGYFNEEDGINPFKDEYITDKNYFIENAILEIQKFRKRCEKLPPQTFLLAGKSKNGSFAAGVLAFTNGERECKPDLAVPIGGQYWLRFSIPNIKIEAAQDIIQHKIEKTMPFPSLNVLTSHMKNTIKQISRMDNTVNSNIDILTIV
mgnify:CR=1 FL=1